MVALATAAHRRLRAPPTSSSRAKGRATPWRRSRRCARARPGDEVVLIVGSDTFARDRGAGASPSGSSSCARSPSWSGRASRGRPRRSAARRARPSRRRARRFPIASRRSARAGRAPGSSVRYLVPDARGRLHREAGALPMKLAAGRAERPRRRAARQEGGGRRRSSTCARRSRLHGLLPARLRARTSGRSWPSPTPSRRRCARRTCARRTSRAIRGRSGSCSTTPASWSTSSRRSTRSFYDLERLWGGAARLEMSG